MFDHYNMDDLLTGKQAAAAVHVRPQLICYWVSANHLPVAQRDDKGRPLYRRGDVLKAEAKTRGKTRHSHRTALTTA